MKKRVTFNIKNYFVGIAVIFGISILGALMVFLKVRAGTTSSITATVLQGDSTPVLSNLVINGGNSITLTANTTITVSVGFTVADENGCADVFTNGTTSVRIFRTSLGQSCAIDYRSCYTTFSSFTSDCAGSAASANATATFQVYYFADATDSSSSFSSDTWTAFVQAVDAGNTSGIATSTNATSSAVELNTLLAIDFVTSSLSYGTVNASSNMGSVNRTVVIKNIGNASSALQVSGGILSSGANTLPVNSEHFATSSFSFGGGEQSLSVSPATVSGFLVTKPPITPWIRTTSLPSAVREHEIVINNGYIYSLGGLTATGSSPSTSTVFYAPLNASGTVGSWSLTTAMPAGLSEFAAIANNNIMYIIGGLVSGSNGTSSVYYSSINSDGTLGSWSAARSLPSVLKEHSAVVNNGFVYTIGGNNNVSSLAATTTVFYAALDGNGNIGEWGAATSLPGGIKDTYAVVSNGYIYSVGGGGNATTIGSSTVNSAPINSDGTLGSWTRLTSIPRFLRDQAVVADNNFIYVIGGTDSSVATAPTSSVIYTITNNGTVANWARPSDAVLFGATKGAPAAVSNGFLYFVGGGTGSIGTTVTTTVLYASTGNRNIYWGVSVPAGQPGGIYRGTNTFTEVFSQ